MSLVSAFKHHSIFIWISNETSDNWFSNLQIRSKRRKRLQYKFCRNALTETARNSNLNTNH